MRLLVPVTDYFIFYNEYVSWKGEKEEICVFVWCLWTSVFPVFLYAVTDENKEEYHDRFSLVHINTSKNCNPIRFERAHSTWRVFLL